MLTALGVWRINVSVTILGVDEPVVHSSLHRHTIDARTEPVFVNERRSMRPARDRKDIRHLVGRERVRHHVVKFLCRGELGFTT